MEEIIDYVKRNKIVVLIIVVVIGLGSGFLLIPHKTAAPTAKSEPALTKKVSEKDVKEVKAPKDLVVDIQGAVKHGGVYHVKNGAIVQEVLQQAGGLESNADIRNLNQAQRVSDQMKIYVPKRGEQVSPSSSSNVTNGTESNSKKVVNLNTATVADFKDIKGVGPKKAERIIAYREKNGPFKQVHDLTKVSGIGEKSLDKIKDQLTV